MSGDDQRERLRRLMMAALDGELEPADRAELDRGLDGDPELSAEYQRLTEVTEMTRSFGYREPPDEVWAEFPGRVYNRLERGLGWILLSVGFAVLIVFGLTEVFRDLFSDPEVPVAVRWATVAVFAGAAVLLVSVLRERLLHRRHDPYREVER